MQWSQLKKRVEAQFADVLHGRVQVWMTKYREPGPEPDGRLWLTLDGEQIVSVADMVSRRTLDAAAQGVHLRGGTQLTDPFVSSGDFHQALVAYLQTSIEDLLASDHELRFGLAMLDRRLGQRRFRQLTPERLTSPFVARLHGIRRDAEGWR
jgi:hypothetical protein